MNNNHAHSYQAQVNVCNASNLPSTHNYNATNIPTSTNTDPHSSCLHTTTRPPHTNNSQPSSTITVEQRRVGKQHCLRWSEPLYSTAPSHTHQARTQSPSSGILPTPITAHTDGLAQAINEDPSLTRRGNHVLHQQPIHVFHSAYCRVSLQSSRLLLAATYA